MAKVMVSLPDDLLHQLDTEAKQRGTTRSGVLRTYVEEGMQRRTDERVRRMKEILGEPVSPGRLGGDTVSFIKEEREKRLERLAQSHHDQVHPVVLAHGGAITS